MSRHKIIVTFKLYLRNQIIEGYITHHKPSAAYNNMYTCNGGIICRATKMPWLYIRAAGCPAR